MFLHVTVTPVSSAEPEQHLYQVGLIKASPLMYIWLQLVEIVGSVVGSSMVTHPPPLSSSPSLPPPAPLPPQPIITNIKGTKIRNTIALLISPRVPPKKFYQTFRYYILYKYRTTIAKKNQ
jgi:hypothetical protein